MLVEKIAELEDSTGLIGNPEAMRERWDRDGVLYFRDVINHEVIARGQVHFRTALAGEDLIDLMSLDEPIWSGEPAKSRRPCDTIGPAIWRDLMAQPALVNLLTELLGDEPFWLPIVAHRSSLPTGPVKEGQDVVVGRHQDGFTGEGMDFTICWVPMMDIPRSTGGLTVAVGNHKRGYLHDASAAPKYPIPRNAIPDEDWRTANFRIGDVLLFHHATPHTGLPNQTDRVRISIDFRVNPAFAPRPVIGKVTKVEGTTVSIRTADGEVDVLVGDDTFIRLMDPHPRLQTSELGRLAHVGANVMAMVSENNVATVIRPNIYG